MNEVTRVDHNLPTAFEDVAAFAVVAQEKLKSVRAEISAIRRLGLAQDVLRQKIAEAQEIAEVKTRAEIRIGELTTAMPTARGKRNDLTSSVCAEEVVTKSEALDNAKINRQAASEYERMAANKDVVEKAMEEARENGDVVSRSFIMDRIRERRRAEMKKLRDEMISDQIRNDKTRRSIDLFSVNKEYRIIYADPPWSYNDKQNVETMGGAEKHYPTMPLNEICELPIPAAKDAILFLWVTSPMLEDAFSVIKAWGFKYKTSFVWDKVAHNMGHYNSVRHEFLLICTRGSCTPDVPKLYDSVVSIERSDEHSKKPDQFREMIDTLYPVGDRLEMFAREEHEGWDVWGNMV